MSSYESSKTLLVIPSEICVNNSSDNPTFVLVFPSFLSKFLLIYIKKLFK